MASYTLNDAAVVHARHLIDARQYVLDSDWGEVQPHADDENRYSFIGLCLAGCGILAATLGVVGQRIRS